MIAASPRFEAWEPLLADLAQRHADLPDLALKAREAAIGPKSAWRSTPPRPNFGFGGSFIERVRVPPSEQNPRKGC
jgi:hypothetical protein